MGTKTQSGWGTCTKCGGLFFKSLSSADTCRQDGAHHTFTDEHSLTEALNDSGQAVWTDTPQFAPPQEAFWAYCNKCHGLYRGPDISGGICKDGNGHTRTGSGNYILTKVDEVLADGSGAYYRCYECWGLYADLATGTKCNNGASHSRVGDLHRYILSSSPLTPQDNSTRTHHVLWGETLSGLATQYNTTVNKIYEANKAKYSPPNVAWEHRITEEGHIEKGWDLVIPS